MHREKLIVAAVFLLSFAFFAFKAGDITLQFTGDENFYFESSRQMLESGDWITPQYYGTKRFQKPILFYWLIALAFKIFGINWWAARFPSIFFGALTVVFTYLVGKEIFNRQTALFSSMVLATSIKFFKYTRAAIPDMALVLLVTVSLYFFIRGRNNPQKRKMFFLTIFLLAGLATLVKGPVVLVLLFLVMAFFIVFSKESDLARAFKPVWGIIIYTIVVSPWFIAMASLYGKEFIEHVWSRELLHRTLYFSETKHGFVLALDYLKSLFFYIPIIIVRFFPWSLFLPMALVNSFSSCKSYKNKEHLFLLAWFLSVFIFFSLIGEKHSQYILALSPAFALIVGSYLAKKLESGRINRAVIILITVSLAAGFIVIFSVPLFRPDSFVMSNFASAILKEGLGPADKVATGSHELIPQKLEVYLKRPVERVCAKLYDLSENERLNKLILKELFTGRERVFCLIKKEDYLHFVEPELRERLYVIKKDFLWKRKFILGDRRLKDEYWLVTNRMP